MQENYKIFKVHYPQKSGKDIFNRDDYLIKVVEDSDDECEVILKLKDNTIKEE